MIERDNGQQVVSLTANLHGVTLGESAQKLKPPSPGAAEPRRGGSRRIRGQLPPLEQTIAGLRIGLLLAVLVIFLFVVRELPVDSLRAGDRAHRAGGAVRVLLLMLRRGTTLNVQSFMGAIMAVGIAVANSILLVTFAERSRKDGVRS